MNIHQTQAHADFLKSIGWKIETKRVDGILVRAFIRKLPMLPVSMMKLQRMRLKDIDWDWVRELETKHRVYETLVELDELSLKPKKLEVDGWVPASDYMLTTKTRVVDLTRSEDNLLKAMKPKTRYNIHVAEKHALSPNLWTTKEAAKDASLFDEIYGLLKNNAKRIKMLLLPKGWIKKQFTSFGNNGFVVGVVNKDKQLVNVAVFYCSDDTCSYNHNGSMSEGRRLMGPTLAVWAGMREGKRRGLVTFDFDGVFDERYPKQERFKGFGRFKEGFGGEELYFYPMYRKRQNPFKFGA